MKFLRVSWRKIRIFFPSRAFLSHVVGECLLKCPNSKTSTALKKILVTRLCCLTNPHWQSSRIILFLCKYYIVFSDALVGSLLDVLFLLLAVILSGFHEKLRRNKIELQKKVHGRICVRDIIFLTAGPPFYVLTFYCFLRLLRPHSQVAYLLNGPYKYTKYCYG